MSNDSSAPRVPAAPPDATSSENTPGDALPRRDFLKAAGAGAGMLLLGGTTMPNGRAVPGLRRRESVRSASRSPDIVVIGAGCWGTWTALNLRKMGANVTVVDAYGPGNARSTSGDESRGVRSSYGDKTGDLGELWMLWAREAMKRWIAFDDEWGRELRLNLFHVTGDLIMRSEWDNFQLRTKVWWDKNKIPYQILNPDDVRKAFPVISMDDITAVLYEPDAGVVRARRGCQAVASVFEHLGGRIVIGRAQPPKPVNGRLQEITLDTGQTLRAETFVYAIGPWMGKTFPELLAKKTRVPIGSVCYFATPVNDERFTYPNIPSFNFPGVTGWAALPVDNRGFRVRGTERQPTPPGAVADSTSGRGGRGGAGGRGGGRGGAGGGFGDTSDVPPQQLDPDTSDRWVDATRVDGMRKFVQHRFPAIASAPIAATHSCHYESTSSGNFIIDHHPDIHNLLISAGGNAEGFKFGPVVGEYIAQRALGVEGDKKIADRFKIPEHEYETPPATAADSAKARGRGRAPL